MEIDVFRKRLRQYTHETVDANSESTKAFLFLEFIRSIFIENQTSNDVLINYPHNLYPDLEKSIKSDKVILIKGRVDAFLGNLIIEFENNLRGNKEEEAISQLKRYTAILWNTKGLIEYLCMSTDGLNFLVYRPRSKKSENFHVDDIVLEVVDKFDVRKEDPGTMYKRLDRYIMIKSLHPPTSDNIVSDFGPRSIILKDSIALLSRAFGVVKDEIATIYSEWAKYLSMVYGNNVDSAELFLKHTYLATLAKLMVYSYYQGNTLPISNEIISRILTGGVFKEYGIENFLIEDFFSWIVREKVTNEGIRVSNRILDGLAQYDLTGLNEDVFRELYQQLVDPAERHDLGEYYTPEWLAERIVRTVVKNSESRVLDPACGSGTFLVSTIQYKLSLMSDKIEPANRLKKIVKTVYGIDVHPLAVLISKANYLMSLGNLLGKKDSSIVIPVYMADSIMYPLPTKSISNYGVDGSEDVYLYEVEKNVHLTLPRSLVDAESADSIIDNIKDFAIKKTMNEEMATTGFHIFLEKRFGVTQGQFKIIINTVNQLANLIKNDKDTIHAFILKNIYKPSTIGKFEIVIGNPPWLIYRFVRNAKRQELLKDLMMNRYRLLDRNEEKLVNQLELATLFLVRCADMYLKDNAMISLVMPRSLYTSDQHHKIRDNSFSNSSVSFTQIWDLDEFSPLFNMPACVVFGQKKEGGTSVPIEASIIRGKVNRKDVRLADFNSAVEHKELVVQKAKIILMRQGGRSAWIYEGSNLTERIILNKGTSFYLKKFRQGASIVPRPFWFVEAKGHLRFGLTSSIPYLETTTRAADMAKKDYRGIRLKGNIELEYLYATLLGTDILPFSHLPLRLVVLPVSPLRSSYAILTKENIMMLGHENMANWLSQAEKIWNDRRGDKADRSDLYHWLDYNSKLTKQDPTAKFEVIYNTSGTFLSACVVDLSNHLEISFQSNDLKLNGFVADATDYYYHTKTEDEAYYLAAILNSRTLDDLIKPLQAKGLWGERHIHKKPLEMPIAEFQERDDLHKNLARIGKLSSTKTKGSLQELLKEMKIDHSGISPNVVGRLRSRIRQLLEPEISEINTLVYDLFTK